MREKGARQSSREDEPNGRKRARLLKIGYADDGFCDIIFHNFRKRGGKTDNREV